MTPTKELIRNGVVTCSCGKQSRVEFNAKRGEFVAAEPGWIYNRASHGADWNCGQPDHSQKSFRADPSSKGES